MNLKPLGVVKEILESIGIGISYAYEDLVFVDNNAFLLQFTDRKNMLILHVNAESDENQVEGLINVLNNAAAGRKMMIGRGKYYTISPADEENIRLEFREMK